MSEHVHRDRTGDDACGASKTMREENSNGSAGGPLPASALSEKQRRELWLYITASIATVELLALVGALLYGFMSKGAGGVEREFAFPWLHWAATALLIPAVMLLLAHFADVGLFGARSGGDADQEWLRHLPERIQRLYRIAKSAPAAIILLGIVALAAAMMTVDGALGLVLGFAAALRPHIPHIVIAAAALLAVVVIAVAWLNFRTRKLAAEYQFRREVLDKTGVIIVDKESSALTSGAFVDVPHVLVSGEEAGAPRAALPAANGESRDTQEQ
jgi:hypothetical protein